LGRNLAFSSYLASRISRLGRGDADGHLEDGAGAGAQEHGAADLADDGGHLAGLIGGKWFGM
jgi:hypothetical protein